MSKGYDVFGRAREPSWRVTAARSMCRGARLGGSARFIGEKTVDARTTVFLFPIDRSIDAARSANGETETRACRRRIIIGRAFEAL